MLTCGDKAIREPVFVEFADVLRDRRGRRQVEHLVEVAVKQVAAPIDREGRPAHEAGTGTGIECRYQPGHVLIETAGPQDVVEEATDGHVRDRV